MSPAQPAPISSLEVKQQKDALMKEMMEIHIASKRLQNLPPAESTPEKQKQVQEGRRRLLKIREELIRIQSLLQRLADGGSAVVSSSIQASEISPNEIKANENNASEQIIQIREPVDYRDHDSRPVEPVKGQRGNYILVPRTPTEGMLKAGWHQAHEKNASGVWRDMIEAWESASKDRELSPGQG
jgi:hypothetical protein